MTADLSASHAQFLAGKDGTCASCGATGCHAFATVEEIDATYGSRHDTLHFIWLGKHEDHPEGFVCDSCIDQLIDRRRAEAYCSDSSGPLPNLTEQAAAAAYVLGARRIQAVLQLTTRSDGAITIDAWNELPLSLQKYRRPIPSQAWKLVERMIPHRTCPDDPESTGRRRAVARAATGLSDDPHLESEARIWAAARSQRRGRDKQTGELLQALGS